MSITVCILAAGEGKRMGRYANHLNKALLPLSRKAIITHIIEKFPEDAHFVVALGHRAAQVRTYLEVAHPRTRFTFVEVDRYRGERSGPGYSLLCCKRAIAGPFYFVACDTLWSTKLDLFLARDWFAVADVPYDESASYCNFAVDGGRISAVHDKEEVKGESFKAFAGLGYVRNHEIFWGGLASTETVAGEVQNSNGIKKLVEFAAPFAVPVAWLDVGTAPRYESAVRDMDGFDWSKPEEALYIVNGRVIKFFADVTVIEKRLTRHKIKSAVFPKIQGHRDNFYWYSYEAGNTLYEKNSEELFTSLLGWLEDEVWSPVYVPKTTLAILCEKFYRTKTEERLSRYWKRYAEGQDALFVNGEALPPTQHLLEALPWHDLCNGEPVFFHGDLNFDNILCKENDDEFVLLDWRQDFAGELTFGDLYYDLAKLYAGIVLNYDYIRKGLFTYRENAQRIDLDYPRRMQSSRYEKILKDFVVERGLNWEKVLLLAPITFLNMAPLHAYPFDKFLYHLGRKMLFEAVKIRYEAESMIAQHYMDVS